VHFSRSLCTNVAGVACCAAGTGLWRAMSWRSCVMRCVEFIGSAIGASSLPGILKGSPYKSSVTAACRPSLNAVRIPRKTSGSASVQCWSAWHMMAAFSVWWKRSTSPLAAEWSAVVRESRMTHNLARE
jgi:hypothetical protein